LIRKPANGLPNIPTQNIPVINRPIEPEPIRTFVPAKTIKEAEEWARNNLNVKYVSFKGLDLGVANDMNKSVFRIKQIMPDIKTNGMGSAQEANKAAKAKIIDAYKKSDWYQNIVNVYGQTSAEKAAISFANRHVSKVGSRTLAWSTNTSSVKIPGGQQLDISEFVGVFVNQKEGKSKLVLDKIIQKNRDAKWFTESANDFGYIMSHEIGHEIDKTIGFRGIEAFKQIFEREHKLGVKSVAERLSMYGATAGGNAKSRDAEMIAESWAEFVTSNNPRPLAREVSELMLKAYYERNRSNIGSPFDSWYSEILKIVKQ
jgi:hypothetical protein